MTEYEREKEIFRFLIVPLIVGLLVVFASTGCTGQDDRSVTTAWNVYHGEVLGYSVEIDESQRDGVPQWTRLVHLKPYAFQRADQALPFDDRCGSWCGITGHDYEGDGRWDRVFLCGYPDPSHGCNAVLFPSDRYGRHEYYSHHGGSFIRSGKPSGKMEWEPCPANEEVPQFSSSDIETAISQLDAAMTAVHSVEHRAWTLEEWRARFDKHNTDNNK